MIRVSTTRLAAVVLVACLIAATAPSAVAAQGTARVVTFQAVFVDSTRSSPASPNENLPEETSRTLDTTITMPARAKGRLPLVVLAHGLGGNPGKFSQLIRAWADAGYVVAAPLFPRSSDLNGRLPTDVFEQPADISFVIDQLLRLNRDDESQLFRRIDRSRIGLAGLSLGGWTTYGTVFNSCCHDPRIKATVLMAAVFRTFPDGTYEFARNARPALLLHGTIDPLYPHSVTAYSELAAPKYFITLNGSSHPGPFEDIPDPNDAVAEGTTIAFWDRYLKGEKAAASRLVQIVDDSGGTAVLESDA